MYKISKINTFSLISKAKKANFRVSKTPKNTKKRQKSTNYDRYFIKINQYFKKKLLT